MIDRLIERPTPMPSRLLAGSAEPPLRFTAGADAVKTFEETLAERRAELERWRGLSDSLAFEA